MQIVDNPCQLNGFAFLEFSGPNKAALHQQFITMGFQRAGTYTHPDISLYQQGDIHFILNATTNSQAAQHAKTHGTGACAMGFRVADAAMAFDYATRHGAIACDNGPYDLPAIEAIGGSVIYFVEDWPPCHRAPAHNDCGLTYIDHLTHNVYRGNMTKWANFYESIFNFREIRFFNIAGKMTGLISRALASPCGKIKIPLNESKDDKSQIEEFLHAYQGEGIQHIALGTDDIYQSVARLRAGGAKFLDVPDTYYEAINARIPWHQESLARLREGRILIDGEHTAAAGLLLQIFTENVFGPVFFEIIQRRGNEGFGEGNFQALFEAIERDQMRRGTL